SWFAAAVAPLPALLIAGPLTLALLLPFAAAPRTAAASRDELAARGEVSVHVADDAQGLREILAVDARGLREGARPGPRARVPRARLRTGRLLAARETAERLLWGAALLLV